MNYIPNPTVGWYEQGLVGKKTLQVLKNRQ